MHSISFRLCFFVVFPLVACWVPGLGFKVGFKVQGLGFGFQVEGLGFGFQFCARDFALRAFVFQLCWDTSARFGVHVTRQNSHLSSKHVAHGSWPNL